MLNKNLPGLLLCTLTLSLPFGVAAQPDPRGTAPSSASSANEVAQPNERPRDDDERLERATPDPTPPVPVPLQRPDPAPTLDVVEQAGVGGPTAFGSAGVLEVGGTGTLLASRGSVLARFAPSVGWFVYDGIQLTYSHEIWGGSRSGNDGDPLVASMGVLDASVHMRVTDRLLTFVGVGPGILYNGRKLTLGGKARAGLDVLIGRSGLFRPALFTTVMGRELVDLAGQRTADRLQYGLEIGYAALF